MTNKDVTAAILIIGDEILSGRTQDVNTSYIANSLGRLGIHVKEVRVVPDDREAIVAAVNALRAAYSYVFTTGGIGPTHDDITAECVSAAFGLDVIEHPDAVALLADHYGPKEFTPARRLMTRTPRGATLIENSVSKAPGFQIENVFVMAGVPRIMQAMLKTVEGRLARGTVLNSRTVIVDAPESTISETLRDVQDRHGGVFIGSYPFMSQENKSLGVEVVLKSKDAGALTEAERTLAYLLETLGVSSHPVTSPDEIPQGDNK